MLPTLFVGNEVIPIGFIWVALSQYSFLLACSTEPGRINQENVECFSHQSFDGIMFVDGTYCRTCLVAKVQYACSYSITSFLPVLLFASPRAPNIARSVDIVCPYLTTTVFG